MSPTNCSNGVGSSLNNLLTNYKSPAIIKNAQKSTRNSNKSLNGCNKSQVFKSNSKSTGFYLSLSKITKDHSKSPGGLKTKSHSKEPLSPHSMSSLHTERR